MQVVNLDSLVGNKGKVILFSPSYGIEADSWFPFQYLYLGPFLENAGYEVKVIDARVEPDWENILMSEMQDSVAVGITSMSSPDLLCASKAARMIRESCPDLPISWGGHHVSALPEQAIEEGVADYVFIGPSEYIFPQVLDQILNGKEIDPEIKGVVWRDQLSGEIVGSRVPNMPVFNYAISPGYHLIDVERYRSKNNVVAYFKTRGCPFRCTFCATGIFDTSDRSKEQYHAEIRYLIEDLGFKSLVFRDPTFFLAKKTVLDVAQLMMDLGPDVKWKGQARATSMQKYSESELKFLKDSGLESIMFGIESGSQRMLDSMEKRIKVKNIFESVEICKETGIEFYGSFMFAMPGETVSDLKETINVMREIKKIGGNIFLQNSVYIPLPSTPMYDDAVSAGYVPPQTLEEWGGRNTSSRIDERDDIVWFEPEVLEEYKKVYLEEWPNYKHAYEREKEGEYVNPMGVSE